MANQDEAKKVLLQAVRSLGLAFSPEQGSPPLGGGSSQVRFFAGDAAPLAAWDAHVDTCGCASAFLWVRLARRWRTSNFPAVESPVGCPSQIAVAVEMGVGRCAVTDAEPTWDQYDQEAAISLDDSWRLEAALCHATSLLTGDGVASATAIDQVFPYGPEGGVLAWVGTFYALL